MATRYDLRSDQGSGDNASSYAALPGTGADTAFITHNMTPMKKNLAPGRNVPGCHPSRWIYELINNNFTVCDLFQRARRANLGSDYTWEHLHSLVINGNQSYSTPSGRVLSSVCLECHFHFVFRMSWDAEHAEDVCDPSKAAWPMQDNMFPWHHLVWVGTEPDHIINKEHNKYHPILTREKFVCSAPPCTFQLALEVSKPRIEPEWKSQMLNHAAIQQQLDAARQQEPSRYETATDEWARQAPLNLNTYLKNLLETKPEDSRAISKRNKRFAVLFGPPCFSMFRELEFAEEVDLNEDGIDDGSFKPNPPPAPSGPSGTTEIGTYRGYIEDVRSEVQSLIHLHKSGHSEQKPTFCIPILHADLRCNEVKNVGKIDLIDQEQYTVLGVLPTQSRDIIVNAYKRQWELVPDLRRRLVDSLLAIANDNPGDEMLQEYAVTQSSVFDSQLPRSNNNNDDDDDGITSQALNFLGLEPPNNHSAQALIQAFRLKLAREPGEASTARSMLVLIAKASTDDMYQANLLMESDAKMSLETSKAVLGISGPVGPWEETRKTVKAKLTASKDREESQCYLDAMDAIADHVDSAPLKHACMELRQLNGIAESGAGANDSNLPVDLTLPVGLNNIGNTCYLNSLLQYLFTVKPIRDIVLNYDDVKLELTDQSIQERRIGGNKMQMDRGEAVVAQAFANELASLFRDLEASHQSATRPSQRLANAVLLSTHTLLEAKPQPQPQPQTTEKFIGPEPPPLPARPSPAPPAPATKDVDMADARSVGSDQTLVDRDEALAGISSDKVQQIPIENGTREHVSVAEIELDDEAGVSQESKPASAEASKSDPHAEIIDAEKIIDITMTDTEEPETVDQKVLNALEHQKRSSGTDQQDVEEVMGSIINRLQAAIRPSSLDEKTGIQMEKLMETFFVTTVNYTKKFDEKQYQHEISFDRSITAFPAPEGTCSLYDALGRNFNQQILEESKLSRYTAIKTLPPVLHVLIQRSQSMGSKNGNPVVIPETLYLDRFMDAAHDSPEFKHRKQEWITGSRITDLKAQLATVGTGTLDLPIIDDTEQDAEYNIVDQTPSQPATPETWDFDGPVEDDFVLVNSAPKSILATLPSPPKAMKATGEALRSMMEAELAERESALETHLESLKQIPYRLHAVICHRGHLSSGHYWVWIHDFEENVWRWYNDAQVKENKNTAEVLDTLSKSGEPYYLCYVRDGDKDKYVDVPKRQPPAFEEVPVPEETTGTEGDVDAEGDFKIGAEDEMPPLERQKTPIQISDDELL